MSPRAAVFIALIACGGGIAWLLLRARDGAPTALATSPVQGQDEPPAAAPPPGSPVGLPTAEVAPARRGPQPEPPPSPSPRRRPTLDPSSDAMRERVEEVIPARLYGEAAQCYKGGLHRDNKAKLTYKLRVIDGQVALADVQLVESTLGDRALERCIVERVAQASWRDDELPDMVPDAADTGDELLLRVRGFAKHQQSPEATD